MSNVAARSALRQCFPCKLFFAIALDQAFVSNSETVQMDPSTGSQFAHEMCVTKLHHSSLS